MKASRQLLPCFSLRYLVLIIAVVVMILTKASYMRGILVEGWTDVSSPLCSIIANRCRLRRPPLRDERTGPPRPTTGASPIRFFMSTPAPGPEPAPPRRPSRSWRVGDQVSFTADGRMRSGTITESNGGGWFRVLMDDKTSRSLRAYQLQPPVPPEAHEEELRLIQTEKISVRDSIPSAVAGENALKQGGDSTPYFVEAPAAANETTDIIESMPKTVIKESASNWTILTPPPPTIFDLDAEVLALQTDPARQFDNIRYLRQVENHMSFDRWVVFTDLHCSPVTLDTCIRVLDRIHEIAVERQAGILFLGDFWHHRGVLRVECLNAVLQCLSRWTQPMVLIPGNHDQVTLGGHLHSLTPLENSYRVAAVASRKSSFSAVTDTIPGPLIFSHPTKFREALFVPHIRDPAILESVLQSPASHRSAAILVHADVTGAYMNDMILSSGGVPPSMFPLSKAVYSGHFHKPHVVRSSGRTIEYLGSPYQVSLSEAQQDKSLAVLDASTGWNCVQRIPIDIGRRHFRLTSLFEFLELEASADGAIADPDPRRVRKGDRVVLVLNRTELGGDSRVNGEGSRVFDHAVSLRKSGVAVEIREVSRSPGEPMGDGNRTTAGHAEELTMESALRSFMHQEVLRAGLSNETAETLVSAGLDILDDIESDMSQLSVQPGESNSALSLQELTVEGFGPFKERLTYPLANRGLVLLRGVNLDGGSDSNGSGKSSLAMASLWCLTGSLDSRPAQDSKVADVVNDNSKTAKVTIKGRVNDIQFSVTRSKSATKSGLVFRLDGADLTAQSPKETQAIIEERLGINPSLVSKVVFQAQHSLNGLLEATDSELKEQLSLVVPLSRWHSASSVARKRAAESKKRASELKGMLTIRTADRDNAHQALENFRVEFTKLQSETNEERDQLSSRLSQLPEDASSLPLDETRNTLEKLLDDASDAVMLLQSEQRSRLNNHLEELQALEKQLGRLQSSLSSLDEACEALKRERILLLANVSQTEERIQETERMWGLDLSRGAAPDSVTLPDVCPTCYQPLGGAGDNHIHEALQQSVRTEADSLLLSMDKTRRELETVEEELAATTSTRNDVSSCILDIQRSRDSLLSQWANDSLDLDNRLQQAQSNKDQVVLKLSQYAKSADAATVASEVKGRLDALEATLASSQDALTNAQSQYDSFGSVVEDLQSQLDGELRASSILFDLAEVFGPRGIQTYVLSNGVQQLQSITQEYLDELSDGSLRLHLSISAGDRITRRAMVREPDGTFRESSLASLSGGQWRRCSLALTLGFADWVSRREQLRSSVLFLDEPLTHLDRSGRAEVGRVLRRLLSSFDRSGGSDDRQTHHLQFSTIVLILQDLAAEELEEAFDCIDVVVRENGKSVVQVNESS